MESLLSGNCGRTTGSLKKSVIQPPPGGLGNIGEKPFELIMITAYDCVLLMYADLYRRQHRTVTYGEQIMEDTRESSQNCAKHLHEKDVDRENVEDDGYIVQTPSCAMHFINGEGYLLLIERRSLIEHDVGSKARRNRIKYALQMNVRIFPIIVSWSYTCCKKKMLGRSDTMISRI